MYTWLFSADDSLLDPRRSAVRQGRGLAGKQKQRSTNLLATGRGHRTVPFSHGSAGQGTDTATPTTGTSSASSRHITPGAQVHRSGSDQVSKAGPAFNSRSGSHRRLQQSVRSALQQFRQSSSSSTPSSTSAGPSSAAANLGDGPSSLNALGSGIMVGIGNKGVSLAQGAAQEFGTGWTALTSGGAAGTGNNGAGATPTTRRSQTVNTQGRSGGSGQQSAATAGLPASGAPSSSNTGVYPCTGGTGLHLDSVQLWQASDAAELDDCEKTCGNPHDISACMSTGVSGGWSAGQQYAYSSPYLINPDIFAGVRASWVKGSLGKGQVPGRLCLQQDHPATVDMLYWQALTWANVAGAAWVLP
jgi:hypothetical protein